MEYFDALLIHPPDFSRDPRNGPPLGLCYISGAAKARGFQTVVLDLNANSVHERVLNILRDDKDCQGDCLKEFINEHLRLDSNCASGNPRVVGISAPALYIDSLLEFTNILRGIYSKALLIAGGYCSLDPEPLLAGPFDVVVEREGEASFPAILETDLSFDLLAQVPGLVLGGANPPFHTEGRPLLDDLDQIPFPDFSTIDLEDYGYEKTGWLYVQRGCYNVCTFCDVARFYGSRVVREMSPERVGQWIQQLYETRETTRIQFVDDNFLNRRGWLQDICEELSIRKLPVLVDFQTRAPDILRFLDDLVKFKQWIYQVELGIESLCQAQLDRWDKHVSVSQNFSAMRALTELGIPYSTYFILGDAKSTPEELEQTFLGIISAPPVPIDLFGHTIPAVVAHYDFNLLLDLHGDLLVGNQTWLETLSEFLDQTENLASQIYLLCVGIASTGSPESSRVPTPVAVGTEQTMSSLPEHRQKRTSSDSTILDLDATTIFHAFLVLAERIMRQRLETAVSIAHTLFHKKSSRHTRFLRKQVNSFRRDATRFLDSIIHLRGFDPSLLRS